VEISAAHALSQVPTRTEADIKMFALMQAFGSKKVTDFVSQAQNEAKHMS
jgi:hypothetical protein